MSESKARAMAWFYLTLFGDDAHFVARLFWEHRDIRHQIDLAHMEDKKNERERKFNWKEEWRSHAYTHQVL